MLIRYGKDRVCNEKDSYVRRDLLEPLVGHVVVVDLAGQAKVLGGLLEVAEKPEKGARYFFNF